MLSLPITMITASIFGLLFVWLCIHVIGARGKYGTLIGDGSHTELEFRIRKHGNFVEYVPLFLILLGLLEIHGAHPTALIVFAAIFVVARVLHILGMGEDANLKLRQLGIVGSFTGIIATSVYGLFLGLL